MLEAASRGTLSGKARTYTGELTITLWGFANIGMISWNYAASPKKDKLAKLGLSRALTNVIPGQATRFLFVPDVQEALYYVPAIIGEALIVVGNLGSAGVAVWELTEVVKDE